MILSRTSTYGIKALMSLARRDDKNLVTISTLAHEYRIPLKSLQAIFLILKKGGILNSKLGKGGGFTLAVPASELTVGRIIRTIEGDYAPLSCLSVTNFSLCPECSDVNGCTVRMIMSDVHQAIDSVLNSVTLAQMIE
jgi:Rrf2 family protein